MLFAIGSANALVARRLLVARRPDPFGPSAWATVFYALFFWAVVTWVVIRAPDWMLCYMVPSADLPMPAVHALFALVLVLAGLSGHTLTAVSLQRGRRAAAWAVLLAGLVTWFGLWGLTLDRYLALGSFADWLAGSTEPIMRSSLAPTLNVVGALDAFGWAVPLVLLVRANRRLRPA